MWLLRMPGFTCPFTSVLWLQDWSSFHSESKSNLSSKDHKDQKHHGNISEDFHDHWLVLVFFSTHGDALHIFSRSGDPSWKSSQQSTVFPRFFSEVPIGTQEVPVLNQKDLSWDPQTEWSNMMNSRKNRIGPHQQTPFFGEKILRQNKTWMCLKIRDPKIHQFPAKTANMNLYVGEFRGSLFLRHAHLLRHQTQELGSIMGQSKIDLATSRWLHSLWSVEPGRQHLRFGGRADVFS